MGPRSRRLGGDKGLITGREGGAFAPAASCLRCELAAILVRPGTYLRNKHL